MKRFWGAYGNMPDDTQLRALRSRPRRSSQQFRNPVHCAEPSLDGLSTSATAPNDRIQVFRKTASS